MPFDSDPLVSIVTPARNVGAFLARALESALNQTVGEVEVIVVDDGSNDDTAEVASRIRSRDARIVLLSTGGVGVSAARNAAMAGARGRYFAFLDADDEWAPTFLAEQLRIFTLRPEAAVVTGNALNRGGPCDGRPVRVWPQAVQELTLRDIVEREDAVFIMSVLRREVYEAIGGFDPNRRRSEDYHFWVRAAVAGFRFVANPAPLGFYRRRPDSASADESAMLSAMASVLSEIEPSVRDPDTRAALARQLHRLRSRYLISEAKTSLAEGNGAEAAGHLRALAQVRGAIGRHTALGLLSRFCPPTLLVPLYKGKRWSERHRRAAGVLAALGAALTIGAAVSLRPAPIQCTLPAEPFRPLNLASQTDRDHLDADVRNVLTVARKYADRMAQLPLTSQSPDAIAGHKVQGPRAYNYCRIVSFEELARIHAVQADFLQTLADAQDLELRLKGTNRTTGGTGLKAAR